MLDDRKLKVLYAIIDNYIHTADPVGSRTIWKQYDLGVSSATIRNEMSDLEELGYLNKPHSSAGRIPSDKAYRLYVNNLMEEEQDQKNIRENLKIKEILNNETKEFEKIIQNSAKILSAITNYTAIVASPKMKNSLIKNIQLVSLDELGILIVIVCNNGIVKKTIYKLDNVIEQDELNILTNFLNHRFKGRYIEDLIKNLKKEIMAEIYELKGLIDNILPVIEDSMENLISMDLYSDGITNILNFPEYNSVDKAREFIDFIENKSLLLDILYSESIENGIKIIIGNENTQSPIKDISIITGTYSIDGKTLGKIGLIGPTRMNYIGLANTINIFSKSISDMLNIL